MAAVMEHCYASDEERIMWTMYRIRKFGFHHADLKEFLEIEKAMAAKVGLTLNQDGHWVRGGDEHG